MTLTGKRILVTQADTFMGPAVCEVLAEEGAELIADTGNDFSPAALAERFPDPGELDALVVNLAISAPTTALTEVDSSGPCGKLGNRSLRHNAQSRVGKAPNSTTIRSLSRLALDAVAVSFSHQTSRMNH